MAKIFIKDLKEYFGKEIELQAFVDNIRDLQWVQFVILRDGKILVFVPAYKNDAVFIPDLQVGIITIVAPASGLLPYSFFISSASFI